MVESRRGQTKGGVEEGQDRGRVEAGLVVVERRSMGHRMVLEFGTVGQHSGADVEFRAYRHLCIVEGQGKRSIPIEKPSRRYGKLEARSNDAGEFFSSEEHHYGLGPAGGGTLRGSKCVAGLSEWVVSCGHRVGWKS